MIKGGSVVEEVTLSRSIMSGNLFKDESECLEREQVGEKGPDEVMFEGNSHFDFWRLGLLWAFFKFVLVCKLLFGTPIYSGIPTLILMVVEAVLFVGLAGLSTRRLVLTNSRLTIITWCSLKFSFPIRGIIEIKPATWKSLSLFNFSSAFQNQLILRRIAGINIIVSPGDQEAFTRALEDLLQSIQGSPLAL